MEVKAKAIGQWSYHDDDNADFDFVDMWNTSERVIEKKKTKEAKTFTLEMQ